MTPPQPSRRKRWRRYLVFALGAAPAILLTAWWVRGYVVADWWGRQRPPDYATGRQGDFRALRTAEGMVSFWHCTADPVPPDSYPNLFSPVEEELGRNRSGWFWVDDLGSVETPVHYGRGGYLTPLGFIYSRDEGGRAPGERYVREMWQFPIWVLAVPAWIVYLMVSFRVGLRATSAAPPPPPPPADTPR